MSSNENSVSMAERLAEWRRQRDSQQQTVKPAVLSQGQQTQGTLGQKIRSKEKTVLGAAGGGVVGGGALSNKLRVNNSVPKESSKPVAPNASLAPTTFKRSLSQSQPQEPLSTVHQQVQKRTKVVFDLPDHPLQTSIHENINNINATLPSQGPTPISFPINTNFTAKPKPHQTNSSATTVPAAAPPPPHPSSESHETLMTRTTMLSLANKALQDQIAIDAKTRQTLQTQLTSTKQALHHAQTQNETCNQQYTRDLTSLTSLVSAKEAQIKTLLDSVSCFETQVRAQEAQLVGLDKECGVLQDQVHNLEERNRVLLVECEQARENFSNQEIVIQAQHEQKALWDLEKKGLQLTVGQVKEVVEHQRHRISELTLRLAEAEQKVVVGEGIADQKVSAVKENVKASVSRMLGVVADFKEVVLDTVVAERNAQQQHHTLVDPDSSNMGVISGIDIAIQTSTLDVCDVGIQCSLDNNTESPPSSQPHQQLQDIQSSFMDLQDAIESLHKDTLQDTQHLQSNLENLSTTHAALESRHFELQGTHEILTETYTTETLHLHAQILSITTRVNHLLSTLPSAIESASSASKTASETRIHSLQTKLDDTQHDLEDTKKAMQVLQETLLETNSSKIALDTQLEALQMEIRDCYQVIDYFEKANGSIEDKLGGGSGGEGGSNDIDNSAAPTAATPTAVDPALLEQVQDLKLEIGAKQVAIELLEAEMEKERGFCRAHVVEIEMLRQEVSDAYEVIDNFAVASEKDGGGGGRGKKVDKTAASVEDGDILVDAEELERELNSSKQRIQVLYEQVETLGAKNGMLLAGLEKRESKLKSLELSLKECIQEKNKLIEKQTRISGPQQDSFCQTELTCLSLQQAQNAIANMKLLKLDNEILKREMQKEKDVYVKQITKMTRDLEETAGLREELQAMEQKAFGGLQKLLEVNKAKDAELQVLKGELQDLKEKLG